MVLPVLNWQETIQLLSYFKIRRVRYQHHYKSVQIIQSMKNLMLTELLNTSQKHKFLGPHLSFVLLY